MKKVSVVMPVYNGEKYLKESIESIVMQSYSNWELIIVLEYNSSAESKNIVNYFLGIYFIYINYRKRGKK